MKTTKFTTLSLSLFLSSATFGHGPLPVSLKGAQIPPVPGLTDGADPIVVDKTAAIALGKALFWDMNVGSDGMACGSCHFNAGADSRVKNQLNPGQKSPLPTGQTFQKTASGNTGGSNYTLSKDDFPLHQFNDPFDKASGVLFDSDDVVSSAGTFNADFEDTLSEGAFADVCNRNGADPVFHAGATNTRHVEPRNTPTVINSVFNFRNFWDGRANNIFNGSSNWGERDPDAHIWVKTADNKVVKDRLHLINSSLASLAVGPPINDFEMSCKNRTLPAIGRKLLERRPLENQIVHPNDSVLGSLSLSSNNNLRRGLNTRYKDLVAKAFNAKYWSYTGSGDFDSVVGKPPYNQMEANFSMFFGLSLQMYMSTLVSDDAPFDRLKFDAKMNPIGLSPEAQNGLESFVGFHCNICHAGPSLTSAAIVTNVMAIEANPNALGGVAASQSGGISRNIINHDGTLDGLARFMDFGFFNTGVVSPKGDPGVGGVDAFGNPLAYTDQYLAYLAGDISKVVDKNVGIEKVRSCDMLKPVARVFRATDAAEVHMFTGKNFFNSDEPDTIMPDPNGNQNCVNAQFRDTIAYIPTPGAAAKALTDPATRRMAKATQGAFKVPSLRNVALTAPYMHNGGLATLEQVVEFYSRATNFDSEFKHSFLFTMNDLQTSSEARANLITFLDLFTDERVRYEKAPFDHPELIIANGHTGNNQGVAAGNVIAANLATDEVFTLPAVGAEGIASPLPSFANNLANPTHLNYFNGGKITFKTAATEGFVLEVDTKDAQAFEQGLLNLSAGKLHITAPTAPSRLQDKQAPKYYSFRPALSSEPASVGVIPGLYFSPYLTQSVTKIDAAYIVFMDNNGQLQQQALAPMPADWDGLSTALKALGYSNVAIQSNGLISATNEEGKTFQALMDYNVYTGKSVANTVTFDLLIGDINKNGQPDVNVIYANGDRQVLIL